MPAPLFQVLKFLGNLVPGRDHFKEVLPRQVRPDVITGGRLDRWSVTLPARAAHEERQPHRCVDVNKMAWRADIESLSSRATSTTNGAIALARAAARARARRAVRPGEDRAARVGRDGLHRAARPPGCETDRCRSGAPQPACRAVPVGRAGPAVFDMLR